MKKLFLFLSLFIFSISGENKIVAFVGNKPIFEKDILIKSQIGNISFPLAFKTLIEERLLLYEAEKQGIEVNEKEVANEIEKIKKNFVSLQDFYNYLKSIGITRLQLEEEIKNNLKIKKLIKKEIVDKIEITPLEIAREYEKIGNEMNEYEFYFKWFENKEEAENFSKNFNQELLKDMEYAKLKSSEIINEILEKLEKAEKNTIMEPFQINQKWIVIYLTNKISMEMSKYEKYKEIKERIFKTKYSEIYKDYIEKLKKTIPIEIIQ
ncbi:MAG: SurA N-terminal domain-containing protein [Candidatus Omnitrophica bacterium]|nr:SurA N-terminal domain-containing protein [Candidatus Omnitrophota bacterium]